MIQMEDGLKAHELLKNEIFTKAYEKCVNEIQDEILSSRPSETQNREDLYFEHKALKRILMRLVHYVNEAIVDDEENKL